MDAPDIVAEPTRRPAAHPSGQALDLTATRRIHVVGVGGAGMSAIAEVLARMGHHVSGSDLKASSALTRLELLGVATHVGHDGANLPDGVDAVVVSTAIPPTNPEVAAGASGACPCSAGPRRCAPWWPPGGGSRSRGATARPPRRRCSR